MEIERSSLMWAGRLQLDMGWGWGRELLLCDITVPNRDWILASREGEAAEIQLLTEQRHNTTGSTRKDQPAMPPVQVQPMAKLTVELARVLRKRRHPQVTLSPGRTI